jgi:hypothetical protein
MCVLSPFTSRGETMPDEPQALNLSNAVRLNYSSSDKLLDDEKNFFLSTLETKAIYSFTPDLLASVQLRAQSVVNPTRQSSIEFPFAYLDIKTSAVDFRLGKQIIAWGRTDALNPTDVVTPRNYTTLLPFDEDERSGVWGLRSNFYESDTVLASLFYGYRFEPSTLPFVSQGTQNYDFESEHSEQRQLGLRVSESNDDFDASVSAYHGASLLGQAEYVDVLPGGGNVTTLRYPTITMVGADYASNFGKFGVRLEGAYVRPENIGQMAEIGMKPYRYLVAAADHTFFSDLNINFQLFGRWTSDYQPSSVFCNTNLRSIASLNELIFVQTRQNTYGMTFRIANLWMNQTASAELFVQHYFGDNSTYLHPMATYAISDNTKLAVGAIWYLGSEGTLFGVMKKNNGAFSELRYSF